MADGESRMRKAPDHRGLPRGERVGPLILLVLLVGAFVPSVLISFDLQGLVAAMAKAALAEAAIPAGRGPGPSLGQAGLAGEALSPAVLASPGFQASPDSGPRANPCPEAGSLASGALAQPVPGGHEWPPGPASSPRSPPPPPALA